ncbi:sugar transporter ERD6-like 16 isoform X2 [Arachis ipaensis]|uniref:sugar transporter ERD6-like 16 isoform X2 n=1 Tax=Arachis ipaensis TaxID=130454 RepID=UPI000A2B4B7F|nr:sugar transporter ERD6-like 16 isoform X2 [Arachis ipaensis]
MAVFHVCSLVTIGAMLGDVTSGQITDFFGRKRAMRMSTAFCITGWLALFFSKILTHSTLEDFSQDMELELSHMWFLYI